MGTLRQELSAETARKRLRIIALVVVGAVAASAVLYLSASGGGASREPPRKTAHRCQVKLDSRGIFVDGTGANRETALAVCKQAGSAEVTLAPDYRRDEWGPLRGMLTSAHLDIILHQPHGEPPPTEPPPAALTAPVDHH
jgi:hypothetical protein